MPDRCPFAYWDPMEDAGSFTGGPRKGVLHTTEAPNYAAARSAYRANRSSPHFDATFEAGFTEFYQHIPVSRAARALKNASGGVQTNTDGAIQIEIQGYAGDPRGYSPRFLDDLAKLMRWIEANAGVQRLCTVTFVGPELSPARVNAPQRMSAAEWDSYAGWCGHQHVPENDHWDPGALDIQYLLAAGGQAPASTGEPELNKPELELLQNTFNQASNAAKDAAAAKLAAENVRGDLLKIIKLLDTEGVIDLDDDGQPG